MILKYFSTFNKKIFMKNIFKGHNKNIEEQTTSHGKFSYPVQKLF